MIEERRASLAVSFCHHTLFPIVSNAYAQYTVVMNPENTPPTIEPDIKSQSAKVKNGITFKEISKEIIIFIIIAFGVVLPFRLYIAEPYIVDGASMNPTFETGNYLIVDKLSYKISEPKRNTVIVFKYPSNPKKDFIKRIIGLPGETVIMKNNIVSIINEANPKGFIIDQSYVTHHCLQTDKNCIISFEKKLGIDEYFVLGDNRRESFDSRSWGPLNKKYLLGKPILRLWPLNKIEFLPGEYITPISIL